MKITEYPEAQSLAEDDVFIVDNPNDGTRKMPQSKLPWGQGGGSVPATEPVWISHRNTYRGKSLGDVFTDEQKEAISSQTFNDLYIGDYWTIGNFDWLIADINYWLNTGYPKCETPHLVILPKTFLYSAAMNDSLTTTGGYVGSKMYSTNLNTAKTIIYTAFGENNILNHKEIFSNTVTNGQITSETWVDSKVDLMNQIMIFGSIIFNDVRETGANSEPKSFTIDTTQLSIFKLRPDIITPLEKSYWTRDVVSNRVFSAVTNDGRAWHNGANDANGGVRPVFGLTGGN